MARLTIEQVKAPDFSASSEMMARANESFNRGMDSARSILDKYNEGQQAKGDQALLGQLAGLDSEEALNNFLATTDLSSMNLSDGMRENILGARASILGNDSTRIGNNNAIDANSRANAGEGRAAAEYADGVAARDELRGLTGLYTAAYTEGQQYGNGAAATGGNTREILAKTLMAEAGNQGYDGMMAVGSVIRNRADNGRYGGNTIDGVIMRPGQFSAWNSVTGYAGGEQGQDMAAMRPSEEAYRAADAILSGDYTDTTGGATHYYNPDVSTPAWGAGPRPDGNPGEWTRIGAHIFGNPDGPAAPGNGTRAAIDPGAIVSNGPQGPAGAAFAEALARSTYMTPDVAKDFLDGQYANQAAGQTLIDAAEARRQTELGAAATLAAIQDPNNLTGDAVTADLMATPGMSASNVLALAGQDRSQFAGVIAPNVGPNVEVNAALDRASQGEAATLAADPLTRSFEMASAFDSSESMGADLVAEFPIMEGSGMDAAYIERRVSSMAQDAGITPGEMAASLAKNSSGNAEQFYAMLNASSDTEMYGHAMSLADRDFGAEAKSSYETLQADAVRSGAERDALRLQIDAVRVSAAKLPSGSTERQAAEQQVRMMEVAVVAQENPVEAKNRTNEYLANRIIGFDPNNIAGRRADLERVIMEDDSLNQEEKLLLVLGLRV